MKEQTSVEWLVEQLQEMLRQVKAIEGNPFKETIKAFDL